MQIVFDIGGTKLRMAVSVDGRKLDKIEIRATPTDFADLLVTFRKSFQKLTQGEPITKAAGGAAGTLNLEKTTWVQCFKHPHWVGQPIKEKLEEIVGASVYLENDAALAGLGEATFGAGQDYRIVVYLTASTGLGGTRIVDKKIDAKVWGFEPGKQIVDLDFGDGTDPLKETHIEHLLSGKYIEINYKQKPEDIHDPKVWQHLTNLLAIGLHNTIAFWSPEVIVLGGSLMKSIDLKSLNNYLKNYLKFVPEPPILVRASLGDYSGLYGGLHHLKSVT